MTRTIETTATNDIALNAVGDISIVTGIEAVLGNCQTAIKAQRGEMQFAVNKGMPTLAVAWNDYNPVQFEAAARTILKSVEGVVSIPEFTVSRTAATLRYSAVIKTIYGAGQING
jgi:hypothetical protein